MTLHKAIVRVLETEGTCTTSEIARRINAYGLYMRKDGEPVSASQISARINSYRGLFKRKNGKIYLQS